MIPILLVGGAVATILIAWKTLRPAASQASGVPQPVSTFSGTPMYNPVPPTNPAPSALVAAPGSGTIATGIGLAAASTGLNIYQQSQQQGDGSGGGGGGVVGGAIAGLAIVGAIGGALLAAHEARKKQATDENSAVNIGVQGFDQDLAKITQAVNTKQITVGQAIPLLTQIKTNFWLLVSPHIQPGRNGCNSGNSCPGGQMGGKGCTTGQCKCAGSIGAACCVGCNCINGAIVNVIALYQSGKSGSASICRVFGSKYGGIDRPGYQVMYTA